MIFSRANLNLKKKLVSEEVELSKVVRDRIDQTLQSLPAHELGSSISPVGIRGQGSRRKYLVISLTAVLFIFILGSVVFTPQSIIYALKQVPFIKSVFEVMKDEDEPLKRAYEQGLFTELDQTVAVKDQGYTVHLSEILYDAAGISIGYLLESDHKLKRNQEFSDVVQMHVLADGKPLDTFTNESRGNFIDDNHYAGVIQISPLRELPSSFQLDLDIRRIGNKDGKWTFSLPVKQHEEAGKTWIVMKNATVDDETAYTVERIKYSASGEWEMDWNSKRLFTHRYGFEIEDDQGNILKQTEVLGKQQIHRAGQGLTVEGKTWFSPTDDLPQWIIVRPVSVVGGELDPEWTQALEMKIPLK